MAANSACRKTSPGATLLTAGGAAGTDEDLLPECGADGGAEVGGDGGAEDGGEGGADGPAEVGADDGAEGW